MIRPDVLLNDLKRLLGRLEADLRERVEQAPELADSLRAAYRDASEAERTAQPFETWRDDYLTQAAVAWILACVFVRFIEDNALIETPVLAGPGERLQRAKDQRTLYFQQHPTESDREYLHHVFRTVAALPAAAPLFDERYNPLWATGVSGDGATLLVEFWQRIDPATGELTHDFTDPALNTRFLGDLYQDLSEAARKKYALLQTPEFVEEFILDRTLTPAIAEFGLADVTLIDPACGSGHFLLGAFHRLLEAWQQREPAVNVRELAQRALSAVHGVDLNPFAVAIARFRLLVAALKATDVRRLADAPGFTMNLVAGDSLLHGPRPGRDRGERQMYLDAEADPLRHVYDTEDAEELQRILGARYHVVVGNPPYITVKDRALNGAYRDRFESCHMKYSLAVPFMERFFDLAVTALNGESEPTGRIGMITANSFMKREFGRKLIEEFTPRWDLTHVIDTSGAYIPGHGTPTVILFGRHQRPVQNTIRAVLGIRGEPTTPEDPAYGLVWSAITQQIDALGSQSAFVSVSDMDRSGFHSHPWSIGGGGAAELKERIDEAATATLGNVAASIGITSFTLEDDIFLLPREAAERHGIPDKHQRVMLVGDAIRDWQIAPCEVAAFPYDTDFKPIEPSDGKAIIRYLWPARTSLANNRMFGGKTKVEAGLRWYEYGRLTAEKLRTPLSIAFAEVATHNHFVLDRGGKVFKQTAPVIKLSPEATEEDHLVLLGLLNSSVGCFWLKQVCQTKGSSGIGRGVYDEKWEFFFQLSGTSLLRFPVPSHGSPALVRELDLLAATLAANHPSSVLTATAKTSSHIGSILNAARGAFESSWDRMVMLQEELDWQTYALYGLVEVALQAGSHVRPDGLRPGLRAFEISMARRMAAGDLETAWFERHATTPSTILPDAWPVEYRRVVEERIALLESDQNIALIEQPENKRRWNLEPWEERQSRALRHWLLDRLESREMWAGNDLVSVARLADCIRRDAKFMEVGEVFRGRADFDVTGLVQELVEADSVPLLPVLRCHESGLRKRVAWERTWVLQRRQEAGEDVGEIPVPPKYTSADFVSPTYWRLRGKLDVPKERFISYPHTQREVGPTGVVGWAGWDHLQQARALAEYYVRMKEQEGWPPERLQPLLAGLLELLPWLKQWHNDLDPQFGMGMGDYFIGFLNEEARALGFTLDQVRGWQPRPTMRRQSTPTGEAPRGI